MSSVRRPVRIANCSGAVPDTAEVDDELSHVQPSKVRARRRDHGRLSRRYNYPLSIETVQADDEISEVNLGNDAEATASGTASGWIHTAWDEIEMSVDLINQKRINVVINGGALNPKGLALKAHELVKSRNLDLKVAWVEGDDLMNRIDEVLDKYLPHLDVENADVKLANDTSIFLTERERHRIVAANAYLGGRAIRRGLEEGADIIICGRVADASPVIGAAAWWHNWSPDNFDALAGALVAGHLIECSSYATGTNFAGFFKSDIEELLDLGFGTVEVDANGDCIVTKHEALNGFVTADTVKCQFLCELQGNIYLNSDVKADVARIQIEDVSKNRVRESGIKGYSPPPTTKLAIFHKGGWQCEILVNATGYATVKKFALHEAQFKSKLKECGLLDKFDVLEFQWVGRPEPNPSCQLASTTYLRIFAQAQECCCEKAE